MHLVETSLFSDIRTRTATALISHVDILDNRHLRFCTVQQISLLFGTPSTLAYVQSLLDEITLSKFAKVHINVIESKESIGICEPALNI
eukprot:TRINITY_DN8680_c0_g1_i1.p1 TRINITY_DN8680_c0_g1~~TRINITY_DN8680_c0_g1_i1.p1  ORF type:complete len:89 (-),score=3.20 TRINITY_DN8680_c0_g1_i1:10-276(-)